MDSVSGVGVLDKSVAVMDALTSAGPASLAELVGATGLPRATVHRLALALEAHGLVARDDRGRFRLGLHVLAWSGGVTDGLGLVEAAGPLLTALRDTTDESAQLYVRDDDRRVCVAVAERRRGLRDTVPVGAALPLAAGSGGTVLRAWGPDRAEPALAAVRRRGWVASVAEREPGVCSVSAPVLDANGTAVAAISVSGPIDRLGRRPGTRLAGPVVDSARELERRAGLVSSRSPVRNNRETDDT